MKFLLTVLLFSIMSCKNPDRQSKPGTQVDASHPDTTLYRMDKGQLTGQTVDLVVSFGAIACSCAQWIETKYNGDTSSSLPYFYLEQGNKDIINADTLFDGSNLPIQLSLSGQFYQRPGYPDNYHPVKGNPRPAKVFRYQSIRIIRHGH